MSPDAGDVEVCAKLGGAEPYVQALPALSAGAITKLTYLDVTRRLNVPAGTHAVALFAAGSACVGNPLLDVGSLTLASDAAYTVVANGQVMPAPSTLAVDLLVDTVTPDVANAKVRFFHGAQAAAALGPIDLLSKPAGGAYAVLFANVSVGTLATSGGAGVVIDANGYATLAPADTTLGVVMAGAGIVPVVATTSTLPATAGLVSTVYAVGDTLPNARAYACIESSQASALLSCVAVPLQ